MEGNPILLFLVLYPMLSGVASYLIGHKSKLVRDWFVQLVAVSECVLFLMWFILLDGTKPLSFVWRDFCGMGMRLTMDGFRVLYGLIAAFMWMMTALFSQEYFTHYRNRNHYYLYYLMTLGATVGVFLSADLYTLFIFFEIMSFTSYVWVAQDERQQSLRAAETYLGVAVIGGLVMLMGLFMLHHAVGTLDMAMLRSACAACENKNLIYAAGGCMLFGFGAKAGAFPLHIWLPKAHPAAPGPASALLSGILTKTGIFGILVISCQMFLQSQSWGMLILLLGAATMFGGAVLAVLSIDLKRTLACSSVSQIGFILIGIGTRCLLGRSPETGYAVRGTLLHMTNHSLIKLALFMAAGVVYMNLHELDLNDVRGFGRRKPILRFVFFCGAMGIGGVPFFNGYISKSLLHEGLVAAKEVSPVILTAAEWLFLISGGLTVAYMLKLYICLFMEKNHDDEKQARFDGMKGYMNKKSALALAGSAALLPLIGIFPHIVSEKVLSLGDSFVLFSGRGEAAHHMTSWAAYFSAENLKGSLISIVIGIVVYLGVVRTYLMKENEDGAQLYVNRIPAWFDLEDRVYRPLILKIIPAVLGFLSRICDSFVDAAALLLRKTVFRESPIPHEREEGTLFTDIFGTVADFFHTLLNRTLRRKHPKPLARSYRHVFAVRREQFRESNMIVARSLSFGLLLFGLGFLFTVIYLLVRT